MPLKDLLFSDLTTRLPAVILAIPTAYVGQEIVDGPFAVGFLLLILIGVGVPQLWTHWPHDYEPAGVIVWTVLISGGMAVGMLGLFVLVRPFLGGLPAAILSFLCMELGPLLIVPSPK